MAKVVYYGFPMYAHMIQTFPLVEELVSRGEEVIFYANDKYKYQIELAGASFQSYLNEYSDDPGDIAWNSHVFMQRVYEVIRKEVDNLKTLQPDYIIYDRGALWGPILGKMIGVPLVCTHTSIVGNTQVLELQPFWDRLVYYTKRFRLISQLPKFLQAMIIMRKIKKEYNFREILFPVTNADLLLVNFSKQFQPFPDVFGDRIKYIGWLPSNKYRVKDENFPWEKINDGKIIYISLGTTYNRNIDFFQKCFKSFEDTDYQIIISTGGGLHLELSSEIPDNFILTQWVPQLEILKHADVFVTQGGTSSVCESIFHGCPVVVVPQMAEQHLLGYWIERIKLGEHLKGGFISITNLRNTVESVLANPQYRQNCEKMGATFREAGGVIYAVDEIFKLKQDFGLR